MTAPEKKYYPLYCSFCGKEQREVLMLIAGPTVFVCNECVDLCQEIIRDKGVGKATESAP